jgi:hypothetical protein
MEWYSKKQGDGAFTYPTDWAGFNIPSAVVTGVHALGISDYNRYDERMRLHEVNEQFLYKGRRPFNPHFDLDALVDLDAGGNTETR